MAMRRMMLATAMVALTGCAANMVWVKPGATPYDFETQRMTCVYQAELAMAPAMAAPARTVGQAIGQGIAIGIQKSNLTDLCLRASGWVLVSATPVTTVQPDQSGAVGKLIQCRLRAMDMVIEVTEANCRSQGGIVL